MMIKKIFQTIEIFILRIQVYSELRKYFRFHDVSDFKSMMQRNGYKAIRSGLVTMYHLHAGGSVVLDETKEPVTLRMVTKKMLQAK